MNICDTKASPNALGVRTSVPGNGSDERIWARYTAQWWSSAAEEWKTVGGSGVTDWVYLGVADMSSRQAGWTFRFVQPPAGTTYVMRAAVEYEWRDEVGSSRKARKARKAQGPARGRGAAAHAAHRDWHAGRSGRGSRRDVQGHVPDLVTGLIRRRRSFSLG